MSATINYGSFTGRDGKIIKRTMPKPDGCESKEYCDYNFACIQIERATLKAEYKANLEIIKKKIAGKIRIAQRRNKEIKQRLQDLIYYSDPYHNGGVW